MAIRYDEIVKKIDTTPLTSKQLKVVDSVEKWIDAKLKKWDPTNWDFRVELYYANFEYEPVSKTQFGFQESLRIKMSKELNKRYFDADWIVETDFDDGLDGPNFSGPDYWVLKRKNI